MKLRDLFKKETSKECACFTLGTASSPSVHVNIYNPVTPGVYKPWPWSTDWPETKKEQLNYVLYTVLRKYIIIRFYNGFQPVLKKRGFLANQKTSIPWASQLIEVVL